MGAVAALIPKMSNGRTLDFSFERDENNKILCGNDSVGDIFEDELVQVLVLSSPRTTMLGMHRLL